MARHKHADLIHAWAEGAEIQCLDSEDGEWVGYFDGAKPGWLDDHEYRIKPTPKPDVVQGWHVKQDFDYMRSSLPHQCNLKLTFDGETGKLKSAEVLK